MCRLFLSFHSDNTKQLILDFLKQSTQKSKNTPNIDNPRDLISHGDGFGFAWLSKDKWKIYKNPNLYTEDNDLPNLLNYMPKQFVIGHIRKKIYGTPKMENTHPFLFENQVFFQNGNIKHFPKHKTELKRRISSKYLDKITGNTDTEVLFFIFLTILEDVRSRTNHTQQSEEIVLYNAMMNMFDFFRKQNIEISANLIYGNSEYVVITRFLHYTLADYATNQHAPSLYWNVSDSIVIRSEPLQSDVELEMIPENTILIVNHKKDNVNQYPIQLRLV